jgi:hypothetical protein
MDCKTAGVTVNEAVLLMELWVAVIVTGPPGATPVASPCVPAALLMVAVPLFDEDQVTLAVTSWLLLSE